MSGDRAIDRDIKINPAIIIKVQNSLSKWKLILKTQKNRIFRLTLNSLKSSSNSRNILLLSFERNWTKDILNLALKSGILNSDVNVVVSAFVRYFVSAIFELKSLLHLTYSDRWSVKIRRRQFIHSKHENLPMF